MKPIYDDASAGGGAQAMMARLRLVAELGRVRKELIALPQGIAAMAQRLTLVKRANEIRTELKAATLAADPGKAMKAERDPPEPVEEPRRPTAGLYSHDEKRTKGQRQKANNAAVELLARIQSGETSREELTDEDRAVLAGYSGNGGALVGADGKKGSAYEYYTPKPIAEGIWDALGAMGFSGGKILDPAAGTGVFGATAPRNAAVDAVELDETSGTINALVNAGPGYTATVSPFEAVAAATPDESYDAVVTNVPFGTVADRGGNQNLDPKYQKETLEAYFILRSLDKLKPGGLAAFVVPPRCVSGRGGAEVKLRQRASLKAEFLGAYRLPNSVFGAADADTITDVIFFRKYGRDAAEKIEELHEQAPETLAEAKVMWSEFVEGRYFKGEGKRFVLGEFVPKDPEKFRDVDRVKNPASIPEVAKLIRRLPGSRVDWTLLEAAETQPIIYHEGDTLTQAGQTLQLQGGQWVPLEAGSRDVRGTELLGRLKDAYTAFDAGMGYDDALTLRQYMRDTSQTLDMPGWLASALSTLDKLPDDDARARAWAPGLVGLAVSQVLDENGRGSGTDFLTGYAKLSEAMRRQAAAARRVKGVGGELRRGLGELAAHYQRKAGYSALWRGDVQEAPAVQVSAEHGFEGLLYENQSSWVSLEQARTVLGDGFDPFAGDDWCVSADGSQVSRADDYFVGSYGEFVKRIDAEMAAAPNDKVRAKLMRQKAAAAERIDRVDVSRISFNLFSPYVTLEEKAEFLRRFVHPGAVVTFDDKTSEPRIEFDIPGSQLTDREKLIRRIGAYLKNGTITLGGTKLDMGDAEGIRELRALVNKANEQFNGWARGNANVVSRLESQANDPERLRFAQPEDESPLAIPGMNPELELHGYQNAYVRSRARDFSGINGFDVGLGKTFTALAVAQYVQSIGAKKKTVFVVPNSVLSNWQKESAKAYASTDDCLYVGLRDGRVDSSAYDEDLNRIMENRHSKIFMTMEAFERIRLRDDTITGYESYMRSADQSFAESEDRKADERAKGKAATIVDVLGKKDGAAPFLEDMGIDSLVIDEAHCFPAGTLVDGVPIEEIKVGDFVRSFNHETKTIERRRVTNTMRRRAIGLVRVTLKNGQRIVCTHDHPFFVHGVGYVAAEFLNRGYNVVASYLRTGGSHAVRPLRDDVRALEVSARERQEGKTGLLLEGLCDRRQEEEGSDIQGLRSVRSELRAEPHSELEGGNGQGQRVLLWPGMLNQMEAREFGGLEGFSKQREQAAEGAGGPGETQLATDARICGEKPSDKACQGVEQRDKDKQSGRQRCGPDGTAGDACIGTSVADGIRGQDRGREGQRKAVSLQDRYCEPCLEDSHRGGRAVASLDENQGVGCEEGRLPDLVGVESVEVLESGGDGRFGGVCPDGYVYDITVEGNHNFFAEGILVHNCFKNSATTVDFKGGKYLSQSPASKRGLDAQAKAWVIRGGSGARGDGVMLLTATPITNSPLEIYSMMALAVGHDRVNDMFIGTSGADGFMNAVCQIENEDDESIDGESRAINVFKGLNNVEMLRGAMRQVATIKNADDVGSQIKVPDAPERASNIQLPEATVVQLEEYKQAYRYAADAMAERGENRGDAAAFERIAGKFGEPMELIGHPFNLINKMTMLIADPDLDARVSRYVINDGEEEQARALVEQWNAKPPTEQRTRPGPNATAEEAVSVKTIRDASREVVGRQYKMPVKAWIESGAIVLDTVSSDTQDRFEAMADKAGVELDVSVPPKLAAMLENFQTEAATPRGVDSEGNRIPHAKQIIFCDLLGMHNKIRRLLTRRAGVPASAIAVVTGQRNNSPEEIMAVQDGFNAPGEANKYRVIIANEKAEVGINLQKGTQAIHHLTIGWTPDSLTQRNGRGVRQGNKTEQVTVYHYDADGTFDTAKRSLVNSKADWIGAMMKPDGGDSLAISGGMSREQMEALIDVVGDADAVTRIQEAMAAKEAERRATTNRERQRINLDTIDKQNQFLADNEQASDWVARKMGQLLSAMGQTEKVRKRLSRPKMSESARAKNEGLLAELEVKERGLQRQIEEAATFHRASYNYQTRQNERSGDAPLSPREVVTTFLDRAKRGENRASDLVEALRRGRLGFGAVDIDVDHESELVNEWESEVDMARQMRRQAVESYQRQAKEAGGLPDGVAEAFEAGNGVLVGDQPVIAECFVLADGELFVVGRGGLSDFRPGATAVVDGRERRAHLYALVPVGEVVYPGSAKHEECLVRAAAIEDAAERAGETLNTYSTACPAVATRRETDVSAAYSSYSYSLPAPHFPLAVRAEEVPEGSEVLARIAEEQKAVIKRWEGSDFVVGNDVEVVRDRPAKAEALRDYAIAHGLKLKASDLPGELYRLRQLIREGLDEEAFAATLVGEDGDEIGRNVEAFMEAHAPWFDFDGEGHSYLPHHLQRRAMVAVAEKLPDAADSTPASEPAPAADGGDPDEMVLIEGDTRAWKDRIKEYGTRHGSYRRWVRKETAWRVRRQAWNALVADHPRAAQELNLRG